MLAREVPLKTEALPIGPNAEWEVFPCPVFWNTRYKLIFCDPVIFSPEIFLCFSRRSSSSSSPSPD